MTRHGFKEFVCLVALSLCAHVSQGQARVDPTGRPLLVMDDSLGYVRATLAYKVAGEEFYVPDLTRPDWIRSRYQQFATSGSITVYVYAYHTSNKGLHGQMVDISLDKNTASIYDFASPKAPPTVVPLSDTSSPLVAALTLKVLPIVKREMLAHHRALFGPPDPPVGSYSPAIH